MRKRSFLRRVGAGSVAGTSGILGMSGTAAAANHTDGDDTSRYCRYLDDEFNALCDELASRFNSDTWFDISGMNNGDWTGIDMCTEANSDGDSVCIKTWDEVFNSYPDCAGGQQIVKFGADILEKNYFSGAIHWSYSIWIGMDPDGCIWVGEDSGNCAPLYNCNAYDAWEALVNYLDPDWAADVAEEAARWYENNVTHDMEQAVLVALIVLVAVALMASTFGSGAIFGVAALA